MNKAKYVVVVACVLLLGGCAAAAFFGAGAAAGVAGLKYYEGALTVTFEAPFIDTWNASLKTLKEMGIKVLRKKHDLTSGKIMAVRTDKKEVGISLKYKSARRTETMIRVGLFGDEAASMAIKERIRKILFER